MATQGEPLDSRPPKDARTKMEKQSLAFNCKAAVGKHKHTPTLTLYTCPLADLMAKRR